MHTTADQDPIPLLFIPPINRPSMDNEAGNTIVPKVVESVKRYCTLPSFFASFSDQKKKKNSQQKLLQIWHNVVPWHHHSFPHHLRVGYPFLQVGQLECTSIGCFQMWFHTSLPPPPSIPMLHIIHVDLNFSSFHIYVSYVFVWIRYKLKCYKCQSVNELSCSYLTLPSFFFKV